MPTAPELDGYRSRFPTLDDCCYLINNSLGAMPAEVEDELARYTELWRRRGVRAWAEEWWELPRQVGDLVAPILGVGADTVAMHANVTGATATFLSCLPTTGRRRKVVTTAQQFPSLLYLLDAWTREHALELITVPCDPSQGADPAALLHAIDDRTLTVAVSHVEFANAVVNDAPALARRCRATGALLLLDVFQSAGTVPLALHDWGVDAAVGGCLKWLCGGPGAAFLYLDPRHEGLHPRLTGWAAHARPFAFAPPPQRHHSGARRLLLGTPQIPALYQARPGLRLIAEIGVERIRERSLELTSLLLHAADDRGWRVAGPRDPERRGGTVALATPEAEGVAAELLQREVIVDYRPASGIRVAPHFYNHEDECRRVMDEIDEILATGAYAAHRSVAGASPT